MARTLKIACPIRLQQGMPLGDRLPAISGIELPERVNDFETPAARSLRTRSFPPALVSVMVQRISTKSRRS